MIEYLNHKLIEFIHNSMNSSFFMSTSSHHEYIAYQCVKCNNIVFFTLKNQLYWMYEDGRFEIPKGYAVKQNGYEGWHFLNLTCEEEQIRKLLE